MKALPEMLRQVVRDLVERRLWPFAVLLLAVAIVVPVLIGRSAPEAAAPASVAAGPPAVAPVALPDRGDGKASPKARRSGKINDPFFDPPAPPQSGGTANAAGSTAAAAPEIAATAAPKPAKTAPKDSGSTGPKDSGSTAPKDSGTTTPKRTETAPASVYYRAVVRWGTSTLAEPHALARLTPLGGRRNVGALYLGITRSDATYAIFVLGPNATSLGDGKCRAGTDCRMIGLRVGEVQRFTVRDPDGGKPRRFTLRVDSLRTVRTSPTAAANGRAKVHSDGRSALRAMWRLPTQAAVLRRGIYDQRSGLLRAVVHPDALEPAEE